MSEEHTKKEYLKDFQKRHPNVKDISKVSLVDNGIIVIETEEHGVYEYDWFDKTFLWKRDLDELREFHSGRTEKTWRAEFGRRLMHKINENRMSIPDLSDISGISYVQLYNYVNGHQTPSGYRIHTLENILGCKHGYLTNF